MSYQTSLSPWVVYRHLPNLQRQLMNRFRHRNEAEAYMKALRRMVPNDQFEIVYQVDRSKEWVDEMEEGRSVLQDLTRKSRHFKVCE